MTSRLMLGRYAVDPPVVLAPMAGITNLAFRRLCREQGGGLFVSEMITTRALVERSPKTMRMIAFDGAPPRSLQLYGVDPVLMRKAVEIIAAEDLADHVDLNFGCPVPKVTRKGGGSALPWKRRLFGSIVSAAAEAAAPAAIPVTVKMRTGIDADHLTYLEAGRIAEEAGATWVALHARTASQRYSGIADWPAIAELKRALNIPVLGNGDVWEAEDAIRMVDQTGADGVVVGRGCLGRPWLFADLDALFSRRRAIEGAIPSPHQSARVLPSLGEVAAVMRQHAELLAEWYGSERNGVVDFRRHVAWYLKGFPVGAVLRQRLAMASSLSELGELLGQLDPEIPFPVDILGQPRGRTNSPGKVALPEGWLADREDDAVPADAELPDSGG